MKSKIFAKRYEQTKNEFDKILKTNYELGKEYYREVEENRKKMNKRKWLKNHFNYTWGGFYLSISFRIIEHNKYITI